MKTTNLIKCIQKILNVVQDGIWGPKTQAALNREIAKTGKGGNRNLKLIQRELKAQPDGIWGPKSQAALNRVLGRGEGFTALASSFADPGDVAAFRKCKRTGKTDQQCFRVGDNGIGQFGAITAQSETPMVAVHADDMKAKWGSIAGAAHRKIKVTIGTRSVIATVEDRLGVKGRIDLNPAAASALGLNPPFLIPCKWSWA